MSEQSEPLSFDTILQRMNRTGDFTASVLASDEGLPVAAAPSPSPSDADTVAAMVTLVKDVVQQTQTRLGMREVDEVSLVVGDRSRLICRYFNADDKWFVLAVMAPPNKSHRRLTSQAIRDLKTVWSS